MNGRYWVFPLGAPGSVAAFDNAIGATDLLTFAETIAFLGAQFLRRECWVIDTAKGSAAVARFQPVNP